MPVPLMDLLASLARADAPDQRDDGGPAIAVVGTGPRGMSILERIGARLIGRRPRRPLTLFAIDEVEVGAGRIWRADQPRWLTMNNRNGEVTMFSGPTDAGAWRPGGGPSFSQWWRRVDSHYPGPSAYAPRSLYGTYLKFLLDLVEINLPSNVRMVRLTASVQDIEKVGAGFRLTLDAGRSVVCDQVAVCIGHTFPGMAGHRAAAAPGRRAPPRAGREPPRRGAPPDREVVGIVGLGLTFHDALSLLTVGRGGRFAEADGKPVYLPSGREPRLIVAGSRSGFPIRARGVSQRPFDFRYAPRLFTPARIAALRARGPIDFERQVLPWIVAEANLVFWERQLDPGAFEALVRASAEGSVGADGIVPALRDAAARLGCPDMLSFEALAAPFKGRAYPGQDAFRADLLGEIRRDVADALLGDRDGPVKAALEVLRDTRSTVRAAVDFGGLTAESHESFLQKTGPMLSFLSTGPSVVRSRQLIALVECGLVEILGPDARFAERDGQAFGASPHVAGFESRCAVVVDARVPQAAFDRDPSRLATSLKAKGAWRGTGGPDGPARATVGLDVTASPFHPIGASGAAEDHMYVLGITTEFTRWFMHVGIGRPGPWGEFFRDADDIAAAMLRDVESVEAEADRDGQDRAEADMRYCFDPAF